VHPDECLDGPEMTADLLESHSEHIYTALNRSVITKLIFCTYLDQLLNKYKIIYKTLFQLICKNYLKPVGATEMEVNKMEANLNHFFRSNV